MIKAIQEDKFNCKLAVQNWNRGRLSIALDAIDCMCCEFRESCNHTIKTTDDMLKKDYPKTAKRMGL